MRRLRAILALLGVAASALFARGASAADALALSWDAPASCPSAAEVREAALRTAPGGVVGEPLEAEVHVGHSERWTVTIRTRRGSVAATERHLEGASCAALADATAVILSLAMMPAPAPAHAAEGGPPLPATGNAPVPETPPPDVEADRSTRQSPFAHVFAMSASVATDASTLPSAALGGRATLAWTPARARIELGGTYFFDQSKTAGSSAAGATFGVLSGGARGCLAVARGSVELSPCAGADVMVVRAHGFGASHDYDASAAWMSAAAGMLLRFPVTAWLALRADGDALVPLSHPRFVVERDAPVYRPGPLGVRAAIGAELLFL